MTISPELDSAFKVKSPSKPVVVPLVVPFTTILAPGSGEFMSLSIILPLIVLWAYANVVKQVNTTVHKKRLNFFI
ncbi:hypothetical protein GCM10008085_03700 [Winogradskyella epiphytica]|nr:hypothetical protein GCM10008085_03700 [Winogradskyella epiphytica]